MIFSRLEIDRDECLQGKDRDTAEEREFEGMQSFGEQSGSDIDSFLECVVEFANKVLIAARRRL